MTIVRTCALLALIAAAALSVQPVTAGPASGNVASDLRVPP